MCLSSCVCVYVCVQAWVFSSCVALASALIQSLTNSNPPHSLSFPALSHTGGDLSGRLSAAAVTSAAAAAAAASAPVSVVDQQGQWATELLLGPQDTAG